MRPSPPPSPSSLPHTLITLIPPHIPLLTTQALRKSSVDAKPWEPSWDGIDAEETPSHRSGASGGDGDGLTSPTLPSTAGEQPPGFKKLGEKKKSLGNCLASMVRGDASRTRSARTRLCTLTLLLLPSPSAGTAWLERGAPRLGDEWWASVLRSFHFLVVCWKKN